MTKIIGFFLALMSLTVIICSLLRKNDSFFNVRDVIKKHLSIFLDCKSQYVIFYIMPLFFAVGLSLIYEADMNFYENISVIISILLSMLLAILSILATKDYILSGDEKRNKRIIEVVKETINAIFFVALLCILVLSIGLVMNIILSMTSVPFINVIKYIIVSILYYLFVVILLNVLLIVKRISKIIEVIYIK